MSFGVRVSIWAALLALGFIAVFTLGRPVANDREELEAALHPAPPVSQAAAEQAASTIVRLRVLRARRCAAHDLPQVGLQRRPVGDHLHRRRPDPQRGHHLGGDQHGRGDGRCVPLAGRDRLHRADRAPRSLPPGRRCPRRWRASTARPSRAGRGGSRRPAVPTNSADCGVRPSGASSVEPGKTWKIEASPPTRASRPSRASAGSETPRAAGRPRPRARRTAPAVRCRSVARPAAAATGLPLNVPPWTIAPGRRASNWSMTSVAAAEGARRVAAADDLAERREVRPHASEPALRPVRADAEGDDLVEDQQRPDPLRELAQELQERGLRGADAARALDRLDDDRGDVSLPPGERPLDALRVAPRAAPGPARTSPRARRGDPARTVSWVPW